MLAAMQAGRHSVGVEIEPKYLKMARKRLIEGQSLFRSTRIVEESKVEPFKASEPELAATA